jgi:hypothetical protein
MKYYLKVFCRNNENISPETIVEFIHDGFFFESEPDMKVKKQDANNWSLQISYANDKDPVIISKSSDDRSSKKDIEEIKFVLDASKASEKKDLLLRRMNSVSQAFTIQINQEQITDDCWEMLDSVEAMLLKSCDGILYTSDNEFFDERLKKIYKL